MDEPAPKRARRSIKMSNGDRKYITGATDRRRAKSQALQEGHSRKTMNATRAAESRCRNTNHISTLTQFIVNIGTVLHEASETGEDVTARCRDLYVQAMTGLTAGFGRILPSARCAEKSIFQLHEQLKHLVQTGVVHCVSANDPVLQDVEVSDTAFQLVEMGPPQPVVTIAQPPEPDVQAFTPLIMEAYLAGAYAAATPLIQHFLPALDLPPTPFANMNGFVANSPFQIRDEAQPAIKKLVQIYSGMMSKRPAPRPHPLSVSYTAAS